MTTTYDPVETDEASSMVIHRTNVIKDKNYVDPECETRYHLVNHPTPKLRVHLFHGTKGKFFTQSCLPDTGATVSVIALDIVEREGMPIIPTLQDKLFGAGGAPLTVRGSTRFRIGQVHIRALVTESMEGDLLLGWNDCRSCLLYTSPSPRDRG